MAARRNVPYSALPTEDRDEDNVDHRFTYTPKSLRKIPWKSIALALFLLLLGSSLLFLSYFISTGHMEGDSSQAYGLLFLGILAFLPGNRQVSSSLKTKQVLLFGTSIIMLKTKLVLLSGISIVMPKTELDSMRLELLTIRGEEHQGTPLLPFQIISLRFFLIEWAVKILNNKDKNLKLRLGNK